MALSLINASALPPGSYAIEGVAGSPPTNLSNFSRGYILIEGSKGEYHTPIQVTDPDDAQEKFGVSGQDLWAIQNIFTQYARTVLFCIRPKISRRWQVSVLTDGAAGDVITLSIGSNTASYTTTDGTAEDILSGLYEAIIDEQSATAEYLDVESFDTAAGTFDVIEKIEGTASLTVSAPGAYISAANTTGTTPSPSDVVRALRAINPAFYRPGYVIAPGFYAKLSDQGDRQQLSAGLKDFAEEYDFLSLSDPGNGLTTFEQYRDEGLLTLCPRGHAAYYFPWAIDGRGNPIPPSSYVVGYAMRIYEIGGGFRQPPASLTDPLRNITGLTLDVHPTQHAIANNEHNLNVLVRYYDFGGLRYHIAGARTRAVDPLFNTITDRVIFNVLLDSLRISLRAFTFQSIDGQLQLFRSIRRTCLSILETLRKGGALFGADPDAAYEVICDRTNNSDDSLELGRVNVTIYAVPSPFVEKLVAQVNRVKIGEIEVLVG